MRRALLVLLFFLIGLAVGPPHAHTDDEATGRTLLLLGPDGKRLDAVVISPVETGAGATSVFDPALGGETRTLDRGLLVDAGGPDSSLVAWGPGLAALRLRAGAEVVGLRLARAVPFGGSLRFDRGRAAAKVTLLARPSAAEGLVHRTRTDENGVWRFDHVGPGDWLVSVRRGDGRLQSLGSFRAGQPSTERVLVPGSRVEGQIRDGDTPVPTGLGGLKFVLVRLPGVDPVSDDPVVTAEDGTFELDDVPAGVYEARLVGTEHFFDPEAPRVEVPARGRVDLRPWFALRARTIDGRIGGPRDARVGGARVVLVPDSTRTPPPGGWPPLRPVRTDAEGRFVLRGVRPAAGYRLAVDAPGYASTVTSPFSVAGPGATTVPTVLLASGWRLEVRLRQPGGEPWPGVEVEVVPADHPVAPGDPAWSSLVRRAVTDGDGRAIVADLPDGDVRVRATSEQVTDAHTLMPYPPSGEVRTWSAILFPAPGLTGRIQTTGARRAPPLSVEARAHSGAPPRTVRVGGDGTFAFRGLGSEPVDLLVVRADRRDGLVLARLEGLVPGVSPYVLLTLPEAGTIEGHVEDARDGGGPLRVLLEAPVFDADDDAFHWRTVARASVDETDPQLGFSFTGLAPGTYAVRAIQGDNDSDALTIRLPEGATETVDLYLGDAGRVAGTVLDTTRRPLLGASVRLVRLRGDGDAPGRPKGAPERATDAEGAYVFADVAPGVWRVEVRDADGAPDQETIRVAAGESVVVRDLLVDQGGVLRGTVRDGAGRVLDGALLVLSSVEEGPDDRRVRTGRDGLFRAEGLRAGTWRVRIEARAGPFTRMEVLAEVVADETTDLDLTAVGRGRVLGRIWREGRPVPDLPIYLVSRPGDDSGIARRLTTRSDADGRFVFEGLPGGTYEIDVADGGVWSTRPLTIDDGDVLTLDLETWDGRIPGLVEGVSGEPIADATVVARARASTGPAVMGRVRTDPQGRFLIVGLPVGLYDLEAFAPGVPPTRAPNAMAEVEGAERPVTLILGRGGTIDVTVLGPDGLGVTGARLWLEDEHGVALHGRPYVTGYRGRLRLVGTAPGPVWIRASARRYGRPARTRLIVADGKETATEIRLPLPARLAVHVVGTQAIPLTRARVDLLRLPNREPVLRARALPRARLEPMGGRLPRTGVVVFDDLGPGRYVLRIDAGRYFEVAEVEYEIGELDDALVEVELERAR